MHYIEIQLIAINDDPLSKYCIYKDSFFIGFAVLVYLPKPRKLWN